MLRHLLPVTALVLLAATASSAQDMCDPATATTSCTDATTLEYCDRMTSTLQPADCRFPDPNNNNMPTVPNGSCGTVPCAGEGCYLLGQETCVSGASDPCLGFSPLLNQDTNDDDYAFAALCAAGSSCTLLGDGDTCVPQVGPTCTQPFEIGCDGNRVFVCLGGDEAGQDQMLSTDEDGNSNGTNDAFVIPAAFAIDCAEFGGTCQDGRSDGPVHAAFEVNVAFADCVLPDGPAEGEGEGEGEGEDPDAGACTEDGECGRDRKCEDGRCVAAEDEDEDNGNGSTVNLSCASAGANAPFAALLVGLMPLLRRRRR